MLYLIFQKSFPFCLEFLDKKMQDRIIAKVVLNFEITYFLCIHSVWLSSVLPFKPPSQKSGILHLRSFDCGGDDYLKQMPLDNEIFKNLSQFYKVNGTFPLSEEKLVYSETWFKWIIILKNSQKQKINLLASKKLKNNKEKEKKKGY